MTNYTSQAGGGEYKIQFETDNKAHYERVQKVIRDCIDEKHTKIIALDYDGTIAKNSYPQAGVPNWPVIEAAKAEMAAGSKLILWTCREGKELDIALAACAEWGLRFDAVNNNLPEMQAAWGNNPRKIFANEYWDDRAIRCGTPNVYQVCLDVRRITEAEIEELREMAKEQCEYNNPLRMATTCRQHKLGEHNNAVLDALVNLKQVVENGVDI